MQIRDSTGGDWFGESEDKDVYFRPDQQILIFEVIIMKFENSKFFFKLF